MTEYQHITATSVEGVLVLAITTAQLRTPETCYQLRDELTDAIRSIGAEDVVLDLNEVTFVGSVGLLGFLAIRRIPSVAKIVLCNLSTIVKGVFVVCRLLDAPDGEAPFEDSGTLTEAIAQISAGRP